MAAPALAAAPRQDGTVEALRAAALEAVDAGRFEAAVDMLEQALALHMADGDLAGVGDRVADLGQVFEARGRLADALTYYRTALAFHLQAQDRDGVVADLRHMARVAAGLGWQDDAEQYSDQATRVESGRMALDGLVAVAEPLACGASHEIDPDPADIGTGTGKWVTYGYGATVEAAVASALGGLFANMYGKPSCKTVCPDGDPPAEGECVADVKPNRPVSTTPSDYGDTVTEWKKVQRGGKWVVGPITISQFPDGLKAVQSCSACSADEDTAPLAGGAR
jgi:hypothetical protein